MKRLFVPLFILLSLIYLVTSCSEDLPINENYKETAIVYGLLDKSDRIHMIKINRALMGTDNALEVAQIADSNYFTDLVATIKEVKNNITTRSWTLDDTLVNTKSTEGVFFGPEQKLYYFDDGGAALSKDATYELEIVIHKGKTNEFIVSGSTTIVDEVALSSTFFSSFKFHNSNGNINHALTVNTGNAATINTTLQINVKEFGSSNPDSIVIPWKIQELDVNSATSLVFNCPGSSFYQTIKNSLSNENSITKRNLLSIELILTAGSDELKNYITINQPSSTLAQNKITYTNLKTNSSKTAVLGIFSSRYTKKYYYPYSNVNQPYYRLLDPSSTKWLCTGDELIDKLFCSQTVLDNTQTYYCK